MKKLLDKAEEEKEELRGKVGVAQISFLKEAKATPAVIFVATDAVILLLPALVLFIFLVSHTDIGSDREAA